MADSSIREWLQSPAPAASYTRRAPLLSDDVEAQLLRRELQTARAELADMRVQLRLRDTPSVLPSTSPLFCSPLLPSYPAVLTDRRSVSPRVQRLITENRLAERAYSSDPYSTLSLTRDCVGSTTRREEFLLAACADRDRTIQDLRTALQRLQYVATADCPTRAHRLAQELGDAQDTIHSLQREVALLQDRLVGSERASRIDALDASKIHKETIDLQETLLQEKAFEIDRLQRLVQELRIQIALLQRPRASTRRTESPRRLELPRSPLISHLPPASLAPTQPAYPRALDFGEEEVNEF